MPARTELLEYVAIRDANPSPNRVQSVVEWHTPTLDVLSNESRLSCGADLKCSQTEFYYTVCQDVHRIR